MFLLITMILTFRVFATATVANLLKLGEDQKCIVKNNCFRTPNYPNPYIAAECYAEVINAARVVVWSKHFQLFGSEGEREYKRDTLTIQFVDSAKSSLSFFADNGPNNIELSRGDRLKFISYPPIDDVRRNQTGFEVCFRIQAPFFQKFDNYVCNLGEDNFFVNDGQTKLSFQQCETKCVEDNQCKFFEYWQRVPKAGGTGFYEPVCKTSSICKTRDLVANPETEKSSSYILVPTCSDPNAPCKRAIFSPKSKDELESAVDSCLELSLVGDCILGDHGPIGDQWDVSHITDMEAMFYTGIVQFNADLSNWNVSRVTDMGRMFKNARSFDADLSSWMVSRVTNMWSMFKGASAFKADLSNWDVSRVVSMGDMFYGAGLFNHTLCGVAWVNSEATKIDMFLESPGSISTTVCNEPNNIVEATTHAIEASVLTTSDIKTTMTTTATATIDAARHTKSDIGTTTTADTIMATTAIPIDITPMSAAISVPSTLTSISIAASTIPVSTRTLIRTSRSRTSTTIGTTGTDVSTAGTDSTSTTASTTISTTSTAVSTTISTTSTAVSSTTVASSSSSDSTTSIASSSISIITAGSSRSTTTSIRTTTFNITSTTTSSTASASSNNKPNLKTSTASETTNTDATQITPKESTTSIPLATISTTIATTAVVPIFASTQRVIGNATPITSTSITGMNTSKTTTTTATTKGTTTTFIMRNVARISASTQRKIASPITFTSMVSTSTVRKAVSASLSPVIISIIAVVASLLTVLVLLGVIFIWVLNKRKAESAASAANASSSSVTVVKTFESSDLDVDPAAAPDTSPEPHMVEATLDKNAAANAAIPSDEAASVAAVRIQTVFRAWRENTETNRSLPDPLPDGAAEAAAMIQNRFRDYWHRSPKRVMRKIKRRGLASLSSHEVSVLLSGPVNVAPFVSPFRNHEVNGSILQCMDQVDDVREYLPEQTAKLFYIHRLLTWLKPFQADPLQRHSDVDDKVMQLLLHKGLDSLSAKEVEDLLTHVELQRFVPKFNEIDITGKELKGMSVEVVREILPERTRAECKMLVRRIKQLQAISENASNTGSLLRQLNTLFPGEFRSITEPPLYVTKDTTVVQAKHKAAGQVAVKIVRTTDTERYKRAKREMNLFQMFHGHKHICNLLNGVALDEANGRSARCACVFPYYELGTVQDLLKSGKSEFTRDFPETKYSCLLFEHVVDMAKDVLAGLKCMHEKNIVHRDIKPSNICVKLLGSTGEPRLRYVIIDLGVAVSMQVQSSGSNSNSPRLQLWTGFTGQYTSVAGLKLPLGTLPFMSPEQIDDETTVDPRSDIFSFGVTMYICLCGRFPFVQPYEIEDDKRLAMKLMVAFESEKEADPLWVSCAKTNIFAVDEVVMKSIRKLPEERYQSASDMQEQIEHIGRFIELTNSLELYGLDPNTKLHQARAQRPGPEHNFGSSNYRSIILQVRANKDRISTWSVIRAVEELIKIHVQENWAASFVKELEKGKKHRSFSKDVAATAQYMWTSAQRHGGSELCSILNRAIREDDPNTTIHAAVFASAINILLMKDHAPQPWLQKFFPQKYPYPALLGKGTQRQILKLKEPLPHAPGYRCTWRGGGFRDECQAFFERLMGKFYRIPGFLATSLHVKTALKFIRRADRTYPRILWCILLDHRGQSKREFRCKHAKFVLKTQCEGEMEFLFAPYSVFKVIRADFSPQDWSDANAHYTVVIEAQIDNSIHDEDMELAPWN